METENLADYNLSQIMMTLSAIAYTTPMTAAAFDTELAKTKYATQGKWKLVWGPVLHQSTLNLVYVARQLTGLSDDILTDNYAVVVRGTIFPWDHPVDFWRELKEDVDVDHTHPWLFPQIGGAWIANGTYNGLLVLATMADPHTKETLVDFLKKMNPFQLFVTGHSLGGCLASVLAPWLTLQLRNMPVSQRTYPYTYAALSAGNRVFANWYNGQFPASYRYHNTLDIIPKLWEDIEWIKNSYTPAPLCPWELGDLIATQIEIFKAKGLNYIQTNGLGNRLIGTLKAGLSWPAEAAYQHNHNMYLSLLGAPTTDFITMGVVV